MARFRRRQKSAARVDAYHVIVEIASRQQRRMHIPKAVQGLTWHRYSGKRYTKTISSTLIGLAFEELPGPILRIPVDVSDAGVNINELNLLK
jgi:hypothetical protein